MLAAFLMPLLIIVWYSISHTTGISLQTYAALAHSPLFVRIMGTTFQITLATSVLATLLGFPLAVHMARQRPEVRRFLLTLVLIPFWTSTLVKSFAFITMFGRGGLINQALQASFFPQVQLNLLFTRTGLVIAMSHQLLPFVVLPLLSNLRTIDVNLYHAARVMGASSWSTFIRVTLPLCLPGLMAGFLISFTYALGAFITPALLGGRSDMMIANLIDFRLRETLDWPAASAMAVVLLVLAGVLIFGMRRFTSKRVVI